MRVCLKLPKKLNCTESIVAFWVSVTWARDRLFNQLLVMEENFLSEPVIYIYDERKRISSRFFFLSCSTEWNLKCCCQLLDRNHNGGF